NVSGTNRYATYNPFRYRGYYYGNESGLYYLNARYYNPEWRRLISPDSTEYIGFRVCKRSEPVYVLQ
ncbi:MAG: RHS repeat-associated core domain-containing protein, partial [Eubacteriales bacterium]